MSEQNIIEYMQQHNQYELEKLFRIQRSVADIHVRWFKTCQKITESSEFATTFIESLRIRLQDLEVEAKYWLSTLVDNPEDSIAQRRFQNVMDLAKILREDYDLAKRLFNDLEFAQEYLKEKRQELEERRQELIYIAEAIGAHKELKNVL